MRGRRGIFHSMLDVLFPFTVFPLHFLLPFTIYPSPFLCTCGAFPQFTLYRFPFTLSSTLYRLPFTLSLYLRSFSKVYHLQFTIYHFCLLYTVNYALISRRNQVMHPESQLQLHHHQSYLVPLNIACNYWLMKYIYNAF